MINKEEEELDTVDSEQTISEHQKPRIRLHDGINGNLVDLINNSSCQDCNALLQWEPVFRVNNECFTASHCSRVYSIAGIVTGVRVIRVSDEDARMRVRKQREERREKEQKNKIEEESKKQKDKELADKLKAVEEAKKAAEKVAQDARDEEIKKEAERIARLANEEKARIQPTNKAEVK